MIETFERLRLYALFASVPYTLLWSHALMHDPRGAASALLVTTHALGLLLLMLCADRADEDFLGRRSLALWRFPMGEREGANPIAFPVLALLTLVSAAALIVASPALGLSSSALLLAGVWMATRHPGRKLVLIELMAPLGILVVPMLLAGVFGGRERVVDSVHTPERVVGATLLGAALLSITLQMCMLRDRPSDAIAGVRTVATRLGRAGAARLAWVWIIGAVVLASMGAAWGWWGWIVSATVALAGAATGPAFARGAWERTTALWAVALWVVGISLFVSALAW